MRMNGKKLTVLLGTAVLAMGILAGCGSSAPEQGQPPRRPRQGQMQGLLLRQETQKTQKQQRQRMPCPLI